MHYKYISELMKKLKDSIIDAKKRNDQKTVVKSAKEIARLLPDYHYYRKLARLPYDPAQIIQNNASIKKLENMADKALIEKNYGLATVIFVILAERTGQVEWSMKAANLLYRTNQMHRAKVVLSLGIGLSRNNGQLLLLLAEVCRRLHEYDEAQEILQGCPAKKEFLLCSAYCHMESGALDQAFDKLEEAGKAESCDPNYTGIIRLHTGYVFLTERYNRSGEHIPELLERRFSQAKHALKCGYGGINERHRKRLENALRIIEDFKTT